MSTRATTMKGMASMTSLVHALAGGRYRWISDVATPITRATPTATGRLRSLAAMTAANDAAMCRVTLTGSRPMIGAASTPDRPGRRGRPEHRRPGGDGPHRAGSDTGRHRSHCCLPVLRGRGVHHRADRRRQRRDVHLSGRLASSAAGAGMPRTPGGNVTTGPFLPPAPGPPTETTNLRACSGHVIAAAVKGWG